MSYLGTESSLKTRIVVYVEAFVWVTLSVLGGVCTVFLMGGLSVAMAFRGMAAQTHPTDFIIMLFITIPASFIYAFFVRRANVIKAVLGGAIFSAPIVLTCYFWNGDARRLDSGEQARVLHQVAHFTAGAALCASAFFAIGAQVSKASIQQQCAGAASNGGPATKLGNSDVTEGPPSVS